MSTAARYRYPHFKLHLLMEDLSFGSGPRPSEPMPDFDLPTVDGGWVSRADFIGRRPLCLTFASIT